MSAGNPERMNVFDPNTHIQTIVIVGCGGTGAQVARIVARIVYDMRRARLHTPGILLVDPDIVEEKNVGRQLFTPADAALKLPKVEVVGRRLNMALGLDIAWCVEPFDAEKHSSRYGSQLVIGCVDNHLARRDLHKAQGPAHATGSPQGITVSREYATKNELSSVPSHFRDAYDETISRADASGDARVRSLHASLRAEAGDIVSVECMEFQATRP